MRWIVRLFCVLMILGGVGMGFVYPLAGDALSGRNLGRWTVFERASGFIPVTVPVAATDAPLRVTLEARLAGPLVVSSGGVLLTATASANGKTMLASVIKVTDVQTKLVDPQSGELDFTAAAGVIETVEAGPYQFVVGPGDVETDKLLRVELVVTSVGPAGDARIQPVGYTLVVLGFIGLVLSFRRSSHPSNPNSQPPAPKWGRDAGKG